MNKQQPINITVNRKDKVDVVRFTISITTTHEIISYVDGNNTSIVLPDTDSDIIHIKVKVDSIDNTILLDRYEYVIGSNIDKIEFIL